MILLSRYLLAVVHQSRIAFFSFYNWGPDIPSNCGELGLTCIPMLWSNAGDKVSAFQSVVKAGYANYVLGFNE